MFKRNLWKLTLTLLISGWALSSMLPLQDTPFNDYIESEVTARQAEFTALMTQASERVGSGQSPTLFIALKEIGAEQRIDLSVYFPQVKLEQSLRNIERRNAILLDYLLQQSKGKLQLGLDLKGGVAFTLEVDEQPGQEVVAEAERQEKLDKAIEILGDRLNGLGVTEPVIRPVGDNRIEVQLPGVSTKDNPEVVDNVKKPARLDFRRVHPYLHAESASPDQVPPGYELMTLDGEDNTGQPYQTAYYVKRLPDMTGEGVAAAFPVMDEYGRFKIALRFTDEGSERFADVTGAIAEDNLNYQNMHQHQHVGQLAIVLDGKLYSAPTVRERINSTSAEITGSFSQREAIELANVLNNPLDLPLKIMEQSEVGPSLATDAVTSGIRASEIGVMLVAAFMILTYTVGGLFAVISLTVNVLIIMGMLASLGATISLPGVAGIVLTIGMAVDSNILIFERIREELNLGKSLQAAFLAGHEKVYSTILDANITTLIASSLMIAFGTGPVKGFGITLTIGVFSTVFCALVVTKLLLDLSITSGVMKKFPMLIRTKEPKIDFLKFALPSFIASWTIVLIGVGVIAYKGHTIYGIDFLGGDEVTLIYDQPVESAQVRAALEAADIGEVNPVYLGDLGGGRDTLKVQVPYEHGAMVEPALQSSFPNAGFEAVGNTTIGPSVGAEIQWNALMSLGLAIVGILIYVAFRFEIGFGVGAVVSTIHDILMTIGIFVLTDRQFSAPMVAAILLIAGYSINDTIVVFDRIREELKSNPETKLRDVINAAINRVFVRSLLTSMTTFLAALALYIFAGGVIQDIAFTFLVGVVTGTFSSIFIASPIFFYWHKGDRRHVEHHQDVKPTYEWTGSSRASE